MMYSIVLFYLMVFLCCAHLVEAVETKEPHSSKHSLLVTPKSITENGVEVYELSAKGHFAKVPARVDQYDRLTIFCYPNSSLAVSLFWSSAAMRLDMASTNYQVYMGPNVSTVEALARASESTWFYSQLPWRSTVWRSKEFKLSPFENTCVGVQTIEEFTISLHWKHVNYLMMMLTISGMVLFFMAPTLCRNTFFHYSTGISLGLLMSVVLLTYLLQRRCKQSLFSWVGVVYSLSVYLMTRTWFNIKEYLTEQYIHLVVGYVLVAGLVSFAVIYRLGPPSNPRTLNLVQWAMQFVALIMVVMSSYHQPASFLLAICMLVWSSIPARLKSGVNTQIRKRFFKPQVCKKEYRN